MSKLAYRRVLLKLSGEALMGDEDYGIDPKVIGRLARGPLVWRYRGEDGLPGEEGSFLVCAFWLVDALLVLGRGAEARARFEALLALGNDLGLYPEEMAEDGAFLGNFPQAFTHLGLVQSALDSEW